MIKCWGLVSRAYIEVLGIWFSFLKIQRTVLEVVPTYWKRGHTAETETVCTRYTSVQGWRSGCIVTWPRTGEDGPWVFCFTLVCTKLLNPLKDFFSFISVDHKNKWGTSIADASLNNPLLECQYFPRLDNILLFLWIHFWLKSGETIIYRCIYFENVFVFW